MWGGMNSWVMESLIFGCFLSSTGGNLIARYKPMLSSVIYGRFHLLLCLVWIIFAGELEPFTTPLWLGDVLYYRKFFEVINSFRINCSSRGHRLHTSSMSFPTCWLLIKYTLSECETTYVTLVFQLWTFNDWYCPYGNDQIIERYLGCKDRLGTTNTSHEMNPLGYSSLKWRHSCYGGKLVIDIVFKHDSELLWDAKRVTSLYFYIWSNNEYQISV